MRDVTAREDWYEIFNWSAEDALGRRLPCVGIGGVAVLEDGHLQRVCVRAAIRGGVVGDEPLHSFDANLCSAVGMWECHG